MSAMSSGRGSGTQSSCRGRRINDGMGAYVGEHVIRLLAGYDLPIRQARVAILGFAFKENVPDIRNSKVIDI